MSLRRTVLVAVATLGALTASAFTAGTASAATPACGNTSLAVTHTPSQGATGHGSLVLLFHNSSHATCTLYGYPGFDALNRAGQAIAHARRTLHGFAGGATAVRTVTLAPGAFASAVAEWMNFNPVTSGPCAFSTAIAVTPANTSHTVRFGQSVSACSLQIHPTVAGTSGNTPFALAQVEWIAGSHAISADHGLYWSRAQHDLAGAGVSYSSEVTTLHQLIGLPDANQTPLQNALYRRDITTLDNFFDTPTSYR